MSKSAISLLPATGTVAGTGISCFCKSSATRDLPPFICKHSINSPFHSKKCDITFVIKVKKLNCYVTSMDHGRF